MALLLVTEEGMMNKGDFVDGTEEEEFVVDGTEQRDVQDTKISRWPPA